MVICINKYPMWSKCHPKNTPVLIYDNFKDQVLYADHYDYKVDKLDYKLLTHDPDKEHYLGFDYRTFKQLEVNYHDINSVHYWLHNKPKWEIQHDRFYTSSDMEDFPYYRSFDKLIEQCKSLGKYKIEDRVFNQSNFCLFQSYYHNAFYSIEKNGIGVNQNFLKVFGDKYKSSIHDKKVYQNYNFYTSTSRPSNAINNLNFAALTNEQRKCFSPLNDIFVEFDYDAYHPRLIGQLVDYEFPDTSVHEYLSEKYGVDIAEGKTKTFQYMYGGIPNDVANKIEFLDKTKKFIKALWEEYQDNSFVQTRRYFRNLYKENLPNMNPQKLFNYYIQAHETETNVQTLHGLHTYLYSKETKIVHYNYDSFLFDYSRKDGVDTIYKIQDALQRLGYKVKSKAGHTYGDLKDYEFRD